MQTRDEVIEKLLGAMNALYDYDVPAGKFCLDDAIEETLGLLHYLVDKLKES